MNRYIKMTVMCMTIWILSAVLNGIILGCIFHVSEVSAAAIINPVTILIGSLIFAIPPTLVLWILMLYKIYSKVYERKLFRSAISSTFILSLATALISFTLLGSSLVLENTIISLSIIISAELSILMHFSAFKSIKPFINQ